MQESKTDSTTSNRNKTSNKPNLALPLTYAKISFPHFPSIKPTQNIKKELKKQEKNIKLSYLPSPATSSGAKPKQNTRQNKLNLKLKEALKARSKLQVLKRRRLEIEKEDEKN